MLSEGSLQSLAMFSGALVDSSISQVADARGFCRSSSGTAAVVVVATDEDSIKGEEENCNFIVGTIGAAAAVAVSRRLFAGGVDLMLPAPFIVAEADAAVTTAEATSTASAAAIFMRARLWPRSNVSWSRSLDASMLSGVQKWSDASGKSGSLISRSFLMAMHGTAGSCTPN